jgi:hypothetical protein
MAFYCTFPVLRTDMPKSAETTSLLGAPPRGYIYPRYLRQLNGRSRSLLSLVTSRAHLLRTAYSSTLPHRHANWASVLGVEDSKAYTLPSKVVGEDITSSRRAPFLSLHLKIAILLSRTSNSQFLFPVSILPFSNTTSTRSFTAHTSWSNHLQRQHQRNKPQLLRKRHQLL